MWNTIRNWFVYQQVHVQKDNIGTWSRPYNEVKMDQIPYVSVFLQPIIENLIGFTDVEKIQGVITSIKGHLTDPFAKNRFKNPLD